MYGSYDAVYVNKNIGLAMARLVEDNFSSPGLQRNTTTTYLLHEGGGENLYPLDLATYIHIYFYFRTLPFQSSN